MRNNSTVTNVTKVHSHVAARNFNAIMNFDSNNFEQLSKIGIHLPIERVQQMIAAMDAIQPTVTTGSIPVPIQFLQSWLPGFVYIATAARKIDEILGITTAGSWEMEEVVQSVIERTGTSVPYGDYTNIPLSSWNANYERRTVVRFEEGMQVGRLEQLRAAQANINPDQTKRESAQTALEIIRNSVGFFGYNSGLNRTYGFLNDPGLPSYVTVANGASGSPLWSTKTFLEIQKDIVTGIVALQNNSQDLIDPTNVNITLAVATACAGYLSKTSDFGISVRKWLSDAYPKVRVVSAPQLNDANGSAEVFYLFADTIPDMSTDGGRTFEQIVPAKFVVTGVQQLPKSYVEDYTNATAGVMLKRPYGVVRYSGI